MSYHQYHNNNSGGYYQRNSGYNNNNYQQRNNNNNGNTTRGNTGYRNPYGYQDNTRNNYNRQEWNNFSSRDGQSRQMSPNNAYVHNDNNTTDSNNQLYMGELDFSWTEEDIKQIWHGLGEGNVKVKLMKSGNSRFNDDTSKNNSGYCFIEFNTHEQASNALMKNGMSIPNYPQRRLKLNWGNSGSSHHHGTDNSIKYSIFVGDLAPNVTDSQLYELFNNKYPSSIESVKVMVDRVTGVSKGYGFVNFSNIESQKRSMTELQGTYLNGRAIKIGSTGQSTPSSQQKGSTDNERNVTRKEGSTTHSSKNRFSLFMLPVQQIPKLNHMTDPNNSTLYVTKISPYISLEEIQEYFKPFGTIILCEFINTLKGNTNNSNNNVYQQAIFQYVNRYDAEKAMISLHQYPINDIPLQISWGLPISREYNKDSETIKLSLPATPQPAYPRTIYSSYN